MRLTTMLLGGAVAAVTACGKADSTSPEAAARLVSEGALTLEVSASPASFVAGDTTWIEVALTNHRAKAVTLHFSSGCQLLYEIENAEGEEIRQEGGGFGCTGALTELTLEPGQRDVRRFPWTAQEFMYPPPTYTPLPAGTYRIYGTLGQPAKARSAPVTVTILPAP